MKKILLFIMLILLTSFVYSAPSITNVQIFPTNPVAGINVDLWANWTFTSINGGDKSTYTWYLNDVLQSTGNVSHLADGFEDVTGWGVPSGGTRGTTADKKEGTLAGVFTYAGTGSSDGSVNNIPDVDAQFAEQICIWIKGNFTDPDKIGLRLLQGASTYSGYFLIPVTTSWTHNCVDITSFPNRDDIKQIYIYWNRDNEDEAIQLFLDEWLFVDTNISTTMTADPLDIANVTFVAEDWFETGNTASDNVSFVSGSNIDLLFSNTSTSPTYKTNFDRGENVLPMVNWTNESTLINSTQGHCNITMNNANLVEAVSNNNFTLCNSGCDSANYLDSVTMHTNGLEETVTTDFILVDVCHLSNPVNDLDIGVSCGTGSETITFQSENIPICNGEGVEQRIVTTACEDSSTVNLDVDNGAGSSSNGHRVVNLKYGRLLSQHTNHFQDNETFYDTVLDLWRVTHDHFYFITGNKTISSTCASNVSSSLDNVVTEQITIENVQPIISIGSVTTNLGNTALYNFVPIEYADSSYTWNIIVTDPNIDEWNITFMNSSRGIIKNFTGISTNQIYTTVDELFFTPASYILNVSAIDLSDAFSSEEITFFVNDTFPPTQTGLENTQGAIGRSYQWDVDLADQKNYTFNISCDNGFVQTIFDIDAVDFNWLNSTTVNATISCDWTVVDNEGNLLTGTQIIVGIDLSSLGVFSEQTCPLNQDLAFNFGYFMMWFLLIILFLSNEIVMKVPIYNYLVSFGVIFLSVPLFACNQLVAWPFMMLGIVIGGIELNRNSMVIKT